MTKRKYSEVEMIGALKQMEAGRSAAEVGRETREKPGGQTAGGRGQRKLDRRVD